MTSESSVVDDHEHDEGGVKDGEGDEELVEGVAHLPGGQDRHWEQVSTQANHSNQRHQDTL